MCYIQVAELLDALQDEEALEVPPVTDAEVLVTLVNEEHVIRPSVRAAVQRAADERAKQAADDAAEEG